MVNSCDVPPLYLMGRLHDKEGIPVGRFFPLAHETMVIPGLKVDGEFKADDTSTNREQSLLSNYPIAVSDQNGKLNIFATREFNPDRLGAELLKVPIASSAVTSVVDSGAVKDVLFFPSYLVPLSQMAKVVRDNADSSTWLDRLYCLLGYKDLKDIKDENGDPACVTDLSVRQFNVETSCISPPTDEIVAKGEFFDHYTKWYSANKNQYIHAIEVPQFYTIQVVFSSVLYEGAEVRLRDLPKGIAIQGSDDAGQDSNPVSTVKKINYRYANDQGTIQNDEMYVATFWVLSENVLTSSVHEATRIDIDFTAALEADVDGKLEVTLNSKRIPTYYSLKENALALNIHTIAGRATVINGDPISVEEALINHAPHFYPHLNADLEQNPYDSPAKLIERSDAKTSLPDSTWATFLTIKGSVELASGVLENGVSWTALSKFAASATSNLDKGSQSADIEAIVKKSLGVTQASAKFIKTLSDLSEDYPNEVTQYANFMNGRLNAQIIWFSDKFHEQMRRASPLWDSSIRPYLTGAGRIGNRVLELADKPLAITGLGYNLASSYVKFDSSQTAQTSAHGNLLYKVQDYIAKTASIQADKLQEFKGSEEKYQNAITSLRNDIPELFIDGQLSPQASAEQSVHDVMLRLNMEFFDFDSYRITHNRDTHRKIASQLQDLTSAPFEIIVSGHTCKTGPEAYNLALSERRALSVKNAILNEMPPEDKTVWEPMIKVIAKGFVEPLPGNTNRTASERAQNRRVEIVLAFSRAVEYPPCRAGLMNVEKAAKVKVAKDISEDEALIEFINSGLNALIGGAALAFPPARLLAASIEGVKLALAIIDLLKPNSNYQKYVKQVDLIRHQDLMVFNQFLAKPYIPNVTRVYLKAYMKRMIAFNGLIRLIRSFQVMRTHQFSQQLRGTGIVGDLNALRGKEITSFSQLDVLGYIDEFILKDDWSVDVSLLGAEHLDEVWMKNNGYSMEYNRVGSSSVAKVFAQGVNVYRHFSSDDVTDLVKGKAQRYNHYFPIHYRASQDDSHFEALLGDEPPKNLDKSVFDRIEVFVRRPYKTDDVAPKHDEWVPFNKYYRDNRYRLTPYDNVKVVVLLKDGIGDEDNTNVIGQLPICLDVMSHSSNEGAWKWSNSVASSHTEFVTVLSPGSFSNSEKQVLFPGENSSKRLGVVFQPSYFFGTTRIFGIRPIANYDDAVMKSLFDSSESSFTSGGCKYLSYFFNVKVPGQSKTKKEVKVLRSYFHPDDEPSISRFNVTLSPSRQYSLTKDFITFSPSIFGDGLFYEETFLTPPNGVEKRYPKVFDGAKVSLYLGQEGMTYHPSMARNTDRDPILKSDQRMRGRVTDLDWNKEVVGTLFIRSKPCDPQNLEEQGYDANQIPINLALSYDKDLWPGTELCPVGDFKFVSRLGCIKKNGDTFVYEKSLLDRDDAGLVALQRDIMSLSSEQLKTLALSNRLGFTEDETVLFASVEQLSYINLFGHEVQGLRPMIVPNSFYKGVKFGIRVNAPYGAGLDLFEGEGLHLYDCGLSSVPSNWIKLKHEEEEIEAAIELNRLNNDELFADEANNIKFKPHMNLQTWMSFNDHFHSLIDKRIDMIDKWVKG